MSLKRSRFSVQERIDICERIRSGDLNYHSAAMLLGVHKNTTKTWFLAYQKSGASAFSDKSYRGKYSPALKNTVVEAYLNGEGSLIDLAAKYEIDNDATLRYWVKVYNTRGRFNETNGGFSVLDTKETKEKAKTTSIEGKILISKECLENGKNYNEVAEKYNVSPSYVRRWTARYEELGDAAFEDRRGQRKMDQVPRTEFEALQVENEKLKHKLYVAELERDLLKKVQEVERRDAYHR